MCKYVYMDYGHRLGETLIAIKSWTMDYTFYGKFSHENPPSYMVSNYELRSLYESDFKSDELYNLMPPIMPNKIKMFLFHKFSNVTRFIRSFHQQLQKGYWLYGAKQIWLW